MGKQRQKVIEQEGWDLKLVERRVVMREETKKGQRRTGLGWYTEKIRKDEKDEGQRCCEGTKTKVERQVNGGSLGLEASQ